MRKILSSFTCFIFLFCYGCSQSKDSVSSSPQKALVREVSAPGFSKKILDTYNDGTVNVKIYEQGAWKVAISDMNNDGIFDDWSVSLDGKPVVMSTDTNGDNRVDSVVVYNILVTIRDADFDGQSDWWGVLSNKQGLILIDKNSDSVPDDLALSSGSTANKE